MSEAIIFKCNIVRCTYDTENYKIFAVDVDKTLYPNIKFTKYGNATILGDLQMLGIGQEYEVTAEETHTKHGYAYKVSNLKKDKPHTESEFQLFLSEILTENQSSELFNAYPDIVDRVINNNLSDIDLNKVKGIKEHTFNLIKQKIIDNYCLIELVAEFQGLLSISILKKLYEKYTSVQVVKNKLKSDPYKCLCGISRVGFKIADSLLLEMDKVSKENINNKKPAILDFDYDLKTSKERCLSCIMFLLQENESNGHTKMSLQELKFQCEKLVPACSYNFVATIKSDEIYYDKDKMEAGLKSTYEIEKYIGNRILEGLKNKNQWNYEFEKYRNFGSGLLTDEQLFTLNMLCDKNICILNGNAGVGKTQTTNSIIQMFLDNDKTFKLLSPTGKAAKVLSEMTHQSASTIHRGLGYIPPNDWTYNEFFKLQCDVVIIDEFSMVDIFLFKRVLEAIDFTKTKLLMIGDDAQLPSVSCGNLLYDFMISKIIPTNTLSKVFRYGDGGLMTVATDARKCKSFLKETDYGVCAFYGDNKDYAFINIQPEYTVKNIIGLYQKLLSQNYTSNDIQILTAYNKGDFGTIVLNNHIQKIANPNYGIDGMKIGETTYYKGDIIIQKVNNYRAKLEMGDMVWNEEESLTFIANGETGIIVDINNYFAIIDFDGLKIKYSRDDMISVGLGYSISIHKSQGSSIKVVILVTPSAHIYMLNSNLIYVGLTRMKEKCFHFGVKSTIDKAIKKKENFDRKTFLGDLLVL